jgi:hypothetical protein
MDHSSFKDAVGGTFLHLIYVAMINDNNVQDGE